MGGILGQQMMMAAQQGLVTPQQLQQLLQQQQQTAPGLNPSQLQQLMQHQSMVLQHQSLWHCLTLPFSLLLQVDHGVIVVHFPKKIIITRYDSNRMLLLKVSQTSFFSPVFSKWPKF
jgi:ABC-type histidine transport system ATPase subunit